ncbi:MAG TPA: divalent-cation tolerance protein CutA [Candidatus Saccharimonadia bacterium]|nr:divalent-cation tolerance protein CutA [Candidatus Saccharimonadia bacterium]
MSTAVLLVYCTVPSVPVADALARTLVEERLAACVNRIAGVVSTYRWEGEITADPELLLLIKTTADRFDALRARIVELHPYELPEVIAVPIEAGFERYLAWIADETRAGA